MFNELQDILRVVPGQVLKVNRALYGLKQSGRLWNAMISEMYIRLGFTQSRQDQCLFFKWVTGELYMIIVYVDDCIFIYPPGPKGAIHSYFDSILSQLNAWCLCESLGDINWILNSRITRNRSEHTISIDQEKYIVDLQSKYELLNPHRYIIPAATPLPVYEKVDPPPPVHEGFRSLLGALAWVCNVSRPDIAAPLNNLARFQAQATDEHFKCLIRILCYLINFKDRTLTLGGSSDSNPTVYTFCDASWSKTGDCKSTSGYMSFLGSRGAISWRSKAQTLASLSSTEAELMALTPAVQDALYWRYLFIELSLFRSLDPLPSIVFCDSSSAIIISHHDSAHGRTKHINPKFYFIRDHVISGEIDTIHVEGKLNPSDLLTKQLPNPAFSTHTDTALGTVPHVKPSLTSRFGW
jgi:hypothetical protein